MTQARREWIATFSDPAARSALRDAAVECMRQICDHDPDDCECSLNMYTPVEFFDWLEREVEQNRQRPLRFEPGHRPRRRDDEPPPTLNLAIAG